MPASSTSTLALQRPGCVVSEHTSSERSTWFRRTCLEPTRRRRRYLGLTTVRTMTSEKIVPADFDPPTSLATDQFRLEPLGPQHNQSDHSAWMSSIDHIRSTAGFRDGGWPPPDGMPLEQNL